MEYHTKLEQFKLVELKHIFKTFQNQYRLLYFFKIYTLNKYDLVCLLRNSNCFEETHLNHVVFKYGDIRIELYPMPKKTIYRGETLKHIKKYKKEITVVFE